MAVVYWQYVIMFLALGIGSLAGFVLILKEGSIRTDFAVGIGSFASVTSIFQGISLASQFQNYFAQPSGFYWEIGARIGRVIAENHNRTRIVCPDMNLLVMLGSDKHDTLMTIAVVFGLNLGILLLVSTPIVLIWTVLKRLTKS